MLYTLEILLYTCVSELLICFYSFVRNEWVHAKRCESIDNGSYASLPSYEYMYNVKWWVWSVDKFKVTE